LKKHVSFSRRLGLNCKGQHGAEGTKEKTGKSQGWAVLGQLLKPETSGLGTARRAAAWTDLFDAVMCSTLLRIPTMQDNNTFVGNSDNSVDVDSVIEPDDLSKC
jgi:hypothetical protein